MITTGPPPKFNDGRDILHGAATVHSGMAAMDGGEMMSAMTGSDPGRSGEGRPTPSGPLFGAEGRIWAAFLTGGEVNLNADGDDEADGGASWGPHRTVRGEVLADLIAHSVDRTVHPRAGLRVAGMKITGALDLRHTDITVPMSFTRCWFAQAPILAEARAMNLSLVDCHLPGLQARLLQLRGDLAGSSSTITGEVQLQDARIGGVLDLTGARLSNPGGLALIGDRASIDGDLIACGGFIARGGLSLVGANFSGTIDFDGAQLHNHGTSALTADRLTVGGNLLARHGFTAEGEVSLIHVRVAGQLNFVDATLAHPNGFALHIGAGRVNDLCA